MIKPANRKIRRFFCLLQFSDLLILSFLRLHTISGRILPIIVKDNILQLVF